MLDWYPPKPKGGGNSPYFANNASSAIRKSVWERYGFDEDLAGLDDIDFAKRIAAGGFQTKYCPEAIVIHVHNENWRKIFKRYNGEAIALKTISPGTRVGLFTATYLGLHHAFRDMKVAGVKMPKEARGILRFRSAQFLGAYLGGRSKAVMDRDLLRELYHPRSAGKHEPEDRDQTASTIAYSSGSE